MTLIYILGNSLSKHKIKGVIKMYEKGSHVRLHTSDSWNNLIGVVDEVKGDTIAVFCTLMPMFRYFVSTLEADLVLERV